MVRRTRPWWSICPATSSPRCYFIPDGRDDPYGKKKFASGAGGHRKALHMQPLWAGAEQAGDALGLVIYRRRDLKPADISHVQSHFVFRRTADIWLGDRRLAMPAGTASNPAEAPIPAGASLVLRYDSAVVGVRVPWSFARRAGKGEPRR